MLKDIQALSGTPLTIKDGHGFRMACCSCGLCHFIQVETKEQGKATLTFFLDEYETKRLRKRGKRKEGK